MVKSSDMTTETLTLNGLIGKTCWDVCHGGFDALTCTMKLGGKIPYKKQLREKEGISHEQRLARQYRGEYEIGLWAGWVLDFEKQLWLNEMIELIADGDERIAKLKGATVTHVKTIASTGQLFMSFDGHKSLLIAGKQAADSQRLNDSWDVRSFDNEVVCARDGSIRTRKVILS